MKNESFFEENNKSTKRIDRVLKFSDDPNANFPNKHKMNLNKNKLKNSNNDDSCDVWLFWYIFVSFLLLLWLLYFFFFVAFPVKKANILASEYEINKPNVDERRYRAIKLDNGIDVLMISDKNTIKNAVSLTVGAGSFQDEEELPGLAHIVEHSILAGSNDFPKSLEFEDLLAKHFGSINSYTEDEKTTFYFDSDHSGFEECMEVFSRLFANPKLDINLIPAHLLKIEDELKKNINKDQFKEIQIIKDLANPLHPFSRFSLGDLEKLKKRNIGYIHNSMKAFFMKYYTPNNMKITIICK